jgi:hypothetical protein
VACSVQDYVWSQYYTIVVLDTAVSGEAILIRGERSGTELAFDNCAILNGLFVNDVRVKEIAKCFRVCNVDVGERVDIQGCQGCLSAY